MKYLNLDLAKICRLFLAAFVLLQFATSQAADNPQPNCHLKVGWGEWPPYQTMIAGQPGGLQMELIKNIAKEANCQLSFVQQSFSKSQQGIRNGDIDLTLDITITPKRSEYGHFSNAYRNEVLALYVRPEDLASCRAQSLESLLISGFRLGLIADIHYGELINRLQNKTKVNRLIRYAKINETHYAYLGNNEIDGFIEDPAVMAYQMRINEKIGDMKVCKVVSSSKPVSIMFSKKTITTTIVERFNRAIKQIKKTPKYKRLWEWQ